MKLREPRDKAAARELEVEAEVAGRSGTVGDADRATERWMRHSGKSHVEEYFVVEIAAHWQVLSRVCAQI